MIRPYDRLLIDPRSGALKLVGTGPLAESFPYISLDRGGHFLLGASYGGNLVSVNPVGADGRVEEPLQAFRPRAMRIQSVPTTRTALRSRRTLAPTRCSSFFSTRRADV
jgi:6-phosphogluconolactonase